MKQVLVAVDRSDYGVAAARVAMEMAAKCAFWEITLVHVVSLKPGQIGTAEYPASPDVPEDWAVFKEPLTIARLAGIEVQCKVLFGHTAEQLLHYAHQEKSDLIIMGNLGESGIKEFFLGSVASRVVAHAPCSGMVVRPGFSLQNGGL